VRRIETIWGGGNLTLEEFCTFFDDKQKHYPVSDSFIKDGYMQKEHGYIRNAKNEGIKRDVEIAEPNQKWHLLKSYYPRMDKNSDACKCYKKLLCPELLLWIAEAAGFDVAEISKKAQKIIKNGTNGRARNKAGIYIRNEITWEILEEKITKEKGE